MTTASDPPTGGWEDRAAPSSPATRAEIRYGGFGVRLVAFLIDAVALGILTTALLPITGVGSVVDVRANRIEVDYAANALSTLVGLVYFVAFWALRGQTVGMMPFNLRVASADTGERIDLVRAFLRYVGMIISIIPLFLGLIWAAFNARKQGWHDKIANTVVVRD